MIKILLSIVLFGLCSARLVIPLQQQSFNNSKAVYYYGELLIGENSKFNALFETRTSNIWLPLWNCTDCLSKAKYHCSASSTCEEFEQWDTIKYSLRSSKGLNDSFTGSPGREMMGFTEDAKVPCRVLWVSQPDFAAFGDYKQYYAKIDGFVGLGWSYFRDDFIDQAYKGKFIQDRVFSFGFHYTSERYYDLNITWIEIGSIPEDKVNKLTWFALTTNVDPAWSLPLYMIQIGGKEWIFPPYRPENEVTVDIGSPYISLPGVAVNELKVRLEKLESVSLDEEKYYICNDNYIEDFPNITLMMPSGKTIILNPYTYLSFDNPVIKGDRYYCQLIVRADTIGQPTLGIPFLRNNFVAFSKGNKTVGIYPEYRPINVGSAPKPSSPKTHYLVGAGLLIVVILVLLAVKKSQQKKADSLKQALNIEDCNAFQSRIGF